MDDELVKWFSELSNKEIAVAGGKGASLAEMSNNGFPVPPGFVVTAQAYAFFIEKSRIGNKINELLSNLDVNDTAELEKRANEIKKIIVDGEMPVELEEAIIEAYDILDAKKNKIEEAKGGALAILKSGYEPPFVAVRSSATAEDLADASFAGQQESFLNVKGGKELLIKVKECFASLFNARAIYYREKKKFAHEKVKLAVVVQRMVDSEKSGVIFSRNPVDKDWSILIEAVWGLGEGIVSGRIKPDQYIIDRNMGEFKILKTEVSGKKIAIVRDSAGKNVIVKLTEERSKQQVLSSYEVKRLCQYALQLEEHYGKAQDIEFAIEGENIYILQSRPVTTSSSNEVDEIEGDVLVSGLGASPGIGSGVVRIVRSLGDLAKVKKGDVLVAEMTNPDMVVTMQKASAIVTDKGGITSHASIISREMGIPAVVGTENATSKLDEGSIVTVDGNNGKVVAGRSEIKAAEIKHIVETKKIKIKVIVDLPDFAQRAARTGAKAVGLVRLEGIIASGGKHPLWFVKEKKAEEYIGLLAKGLGKIAEPFEEIWVRTSDMRSDEFRHLMGAPKEVEGNPMLGDHGIRFGLRHPELIKAELVAMKEVADDFPHKKFGIMIPQVISSEEIIEIKRIASSEIGLPKNVKIGIMVETPAAVQLINKFCEAGISFVSLGTNDLTQYTLAIDRNNSDVQYLYDELHPAILNSIRYVLRRCKYYKVETSICGQAGSNEKMVEFLVREGIDSISINADAAYNVSKLVSDIESKTNVADGGKNLEVEAGSVIDEGMRMQNKEELHIEKNDFQENIEENIQEAMIESEKDNIVALKQMFNPNVEKSLESQDIEEAILKELGIDEYEPGIKSDEKEDIPPLNEAIPVKSGDLIDEKEEEEIDVGLNENKESEGIEKKDKADDDAVKDKKEKDEVLDLF